MNAENADLRPTERFSDRVEYYVRARPGYPPALLDFFKQELGLTPGHRIADIGSGTGLLAELFVRNGNKVIGVEPNGPMRAAGAAAFADFPNFISVNGSAEATGLPDHSIDFIIAGQAFHWFDPPRARAEFMRILVPGGWVTLVWNQRTPHASEFDLAYDHLILRFAVEQHVDHHAKVTAAPDGVLGPFFGPGHFKHRQFENHQDLTLANLQARLASSSYMPLPEHPLHAEMIAHAKRLFDKHAVDGRVRIHYHTGAYYGIMS